MTCDSTICVVGECMSGANVYIVSFVDFSFFDLPIMPIMMEVWRSYEW